MTGGLERKHRKTHFDFWIFLKQGQTFLYAKVFLRTYNNFLLFITYLICTVSISQTLPFLNISELCVYSIALMLTISFLLPSRVCFLLSTFCGISCVIYMLMYSHWFLWLLNFVNVSSGKCLFLFRHWVLLESMGNAIAIYLNEI